MLLQILCNVNSWLKCLDMKLQDFTEQINKISDVAAKEYAIEQGLLSNST